MLTCYSAHSLSVLDRWMGAGCCGKPGRYHWPSTPPHLHQQHSTRILGLTQPGLWQKLTCPPANPQQQAAPAVLSGRRHWPAGARTNSMITTGRLLVPFRKTSHLFLYRILTLVSVGYRSIGLKQMAIHSYGNFPVGGHSQKNPPFGFQQ